MDKRQQAGPGEERTDSVSYQLEIPPDVPEYALPAWASCLRWALGEESIRKAFEADTGIRYCPARCALDLLIHDATGWREEYVKKFIAWFNENVWGKWE
jgi:hypothetical protein